MVVWSDKLRYGGRMREGFLSKRIRKRLSKGKAVIGVYLVALTSNRDNLIDIIDVKELIFPYYKRQRIDVIGMAYSKDAALELTRDIIQDMYLETGGFDIRGYYGEQGLQ